MNGRTPKEKGAKIMPIEFKNGRLVILILRTNHAKYKIITTNIAKPMYLNL
jgi:hypothetical protein